LLSGSGGVRLVFDPGRFRRFQRFRWDGSAAGRDR
jgi:hypothetical protein